MSEQIVKRRPMVDMEEFERRLRKPLAADQQESDLLAELARFVGGQEDPYKSVFEPLNRRPAGGSRGGQDKGETGGRGPQEPLIRGDFAAIEAGLLGAAQQADAPGYSEAIEPSSGHEAGEPQNWHYSDLPQDANDPYAPLEEIRSRRPLYLMAALIVAGVAGIGASFAFKGAVSSQRGEIATIKAPEGPAKVASASVAGSDAPDQGASVLGGAPQQQPVAAVDKTEQPVDLAAQTVAPSGPGSAPAAVPATAVAEAASGAASVPVPPPPVQAQPQQPTEPLTIASLIEPKKVKTVSVRPDGTLLPNDTPPQVAAPVPVPAARPAAPTAKAATPPAAARVPTTPKAANGNPQPARTSVAAKSKPSQVADAQGQASPSQAAPGNFAVQFAAPGTEQEARAIQLQIMNKYGAELSGFQPSIRKAEVGGKQVYRVRVGGIASRDEATALCQRVQSSGGNCFVAKN